PQLRGVRAEEALDVRLGGQEVELLVLERPQVPRTDLRVLLDLREIEALAQARLSQTGSDLEHWRPADGTALVVMLVVEDSLVEADGQCRHQREGEREDPEEPACAGSTDAASVEPE